MNTDYVIHIATSRGRAWTYFKQRSGWTQTAPTGKIRRLTAEQLLSHLLPPLSGDQPRLVVTVERLHIKKATKSSSALPNEMQEKPTE